MSWTISDLRNHQNPSEGIRAAAAAEFGVNVNDVTQDHIDTFCISSDNIKWATDFGTPIILAKQTPLTLQDVEEKSINAVIHWGATLGLYPEQSFSFHSDLKDTPLVKKSWDRWEAQVRPSLMRGREEKLDADIPPAREQTDVELKLEGELPIIQPESAIEVDESLVQSEQKTGGIADIIAAYEWVTPSVANTRVSIGDDRSLVWDTASQEPLYEYESKGLCWSIVPGEDGGVYLSHGYHSSIDAIGYMISTTSPRVEHVGEAYLDSEQLIVVSPSVSAPQIDDSVFDFGEIIPETKATTKVANDPEYLFGVSSPLMESQLTSKLTNYQVEQYREFPNGKRVELRFPSELKAGGTLGEAVIIDAKGKVEKVFDISEREMTIMGEAQFVRACSEVEFEQIAAVSSFRTDGSNIRDLIRQDNEFLVGVNEPRANYVFEIDGAEVRMVFKHEYGQEQALAQGEELEQVYRTVGKFANRGDLNQLHGLVAYSKEDADHYFKMVQGATGTWVKVSEFDITPTMFQVGVDDELARKEFYETLLIENEEYDVEIPHEYVEEWIQEGNDLPVWQLAKNPRCRDAIDDVKLSGVHEDENEVTFKLSLDSANPDNLVVRCEYQGKRYFFNERFRSEDGIGIPAGHRFMLNMIAQGKYPEGLKIAEEQVIEQPESKPVVTERLDDYRVTRRQERGTLDNGMAVELREVTDDVVQTSDTLAEVVLINSVGRELQHQMFAAGEVASGAHNELYEQMRDELVAGVYDIMDFLPSVDVGEPTHRPEGMEVSGNILTPEEQEEEELEIPEPERLESYDIIDVVTGRSGMTVELRFAPHGNVVEGVGEPYLYDTIAEVVILNSEGEELYVDMVVWDDVRENVHLDSFQQIVQRMADGELDYLLSKERTVEEVMGLNPSEIEELSKVGSPKILQTVSVEDRIFPSDELRSQFTIIEEHESFNGDRVVYSRLENIEGVVTDLDSVIAEVSEYDARGNLIGTEFFSIGQVEEGLPENRFRMLKAKYEALDGMPVRANVENKFKSDFMVRNHHDAEDGSLIVLSELSDPRLDSTEDSELVWATLEVLDANRNIISSETFDGEQYNQSFHLVAFRETCEKHDRLGRKIGPEPEVVAETVNTPDESKLERIDGTDEAGHTFRIHENESLPDGTRLEFRVLDVEKATEDSEGYDIVHVGVKGGVLERVRYNFGERSEAEMDFRDMLSALRQPRAVSIESEPYRNFTYKNLEDVQVKGRIGRLRANLAAIKTLKTIEAEHRDATPEEQVILSKYAGFGADKIVFDGSLETEAKHHLAAAMMADYDNEHYGYPKKEWSPDVKRLKTLYPEFEGMEHRYFRSFFNWRLSESTWSNEKTSVLEIQKELKESLSDEEYQSLAATVENAHYTPVDVCKMLWSLAQKAGFEGGNVFCPGIGVGRIEGAMPEELQTSRTRISGVERDMITSRIVSKLMPDADIENCSIEDNTFVDGTFDLAIGNVPFSSSTIHDPTMEGYNLHNYCIAESVRKLKPGGVAIMMTSSSTLQNNPAQREMLQSQMDLKFAFRLPNDANMASANTEVVTDILVLQKPPADRMVRNFESMTDTLPVEVEVTDAPTGRIKTVLADVNEYFMRFPENVLGQHAMDGKMHGKRAGEEEQYTVHPRKHDNGVPYTVEETFNAMRQLLATAPEGLLKDASQKVVETRRSNQLSGVNNKEDAFIFDPDGKLQKVVRDGRAFVMTDPEWVSDPSFKMPRGIDADGANRLVGKFVELKQAFYNLLNHDSGNDTNSTETWSEVKSNELRAKLNTVYDSFRKEYGSVNECAKLGKLAEDDPDYPVILSIEEAKIDGDKVTYEKATVFRERTVNAAATPKIESLTDAIYVSYDRYGYVDINEVSDLVGQPVDEAAILRTREVFKDPSDGRWEMRSKYLSGNVVQKLKDAVKAAEADPIYSANVDALKDVQPDFIALSDIGFSLSSSWMPDEVIKRFLGNEDFYTSRLSLVRLPDGKVSIDGLDSGHSAQSKWGVKYDDPENSTIYRIAQKHYKASKIVEAAITGRPIKINVPGTKDLDQAATSKANYNVAMLNRAFVDWVKERAFTDIGERVEEAFNSTMNCVVTPKYNGDYLTFPSLRIGEGSLVPKKHQRDVVARALQEKQGVFAHAVGYGKTLEICLSATEMKRLGVANKPLIVCDNASYGQFVQTVIQNFPTARILYSTEKNMSSQNRNKFLGKVAHGDFDVILCAQSHFDRIPNDPIHEAQYMNRLAKEYEKVLWQLKTETGDSKTVKIVQNKIKSLREQLSAKMKAKKSNDDKGVCWEQMGIDQVFIDECHRYKRAPLVTEFKNVKGIDFSHSQRGLGLLIKADHVQNKLRGDGTGMIGASGTPVSNTLAETWQMNRIFSPNNNREFNVDLFDNFIRNFCRFETKIELNEANLKFKEVTRLSKFTNGSVLGRYIGNSWDVKMAGMGVQLQNVPELKGGKANMNVCPCTPELVNLLDGIADVYDVFENAHGSEKRDISFVPIMLMQVGIAASIDPRLIDPEAGDNPDYPVNRCADDIVRIYNEHGGQLNQVVFADKYRPMNTEKLNDVFGGDWIRGLKEGELNIIGGIEVDESESVGSDDETYEETDSIEEGVNHFNLYEELRNKLVLGGIPREKIAIIGECKTDKERKEFFNLFNSEEGAGMIVIGSTKKLGTGCNIQERLVAAHHLDAPASMTHSDLTQRDGRLIRQRATNLVKEAEIHYWAAEDSTMPGIFDRIQRKAEFTAQVLGGKFVGSEFDDPCNLDLENMKSALVRDKRIARRAELISEIQNARQEVDFISGRRTRAASDLRANQKQLERRDADLARSQQFHDKVTSQMKPIQFEDGEVLDVKIGMKEVKMDLKRLRAEMKSHFEEWKSDERINFSKHDDEAIAYVSVNGLDMHIAKTITSTSGKDAELGFRPIDPETRKPAADFYVFGSVETMLRRAEVARNKFLDKHTDNVAFYNRVETNVEFFQRELDELPNADEAKEREQILEAELLDLNNDLIVNPVAKRGRKHKTEVVSDVVTSELDAAYAIADQEEVRVKKTLKIF